VTRDAEVAQRRQINPGWSRRLRIVRQIPRPGPLRLARRLIRWGFLFAIFVSLFVAFMFTEGDGRRINTAEQAAAEHLFSIPAWEIANFFDKWTNRVVSTLGFGEDAATIDALIASYSDDSVTIGDAAGRRDRAIADPSTPPDEVERLERELADARGQRRGSRNAVEERLEAELSKTLRDLGFGGIGGSLWPPVDIRLEPPPHVFVTSPRDRIERLDSELLSPGMTGTEAEDVEARLQEQSDLSGIVLPLGGVATYPTFVRDDYSLLRTLELAAHEWLHAYFFFRPLGQNIDSSAQMNSLNETVASIAGEELGIVTWERITGLERAAPPPPANPDDGGAGEFSFNEFMRETRLRVDEILSDGDIDGAEAYMEERRLVLQEHRYFIRKSNQAWFAFHGTYGDSPASASPIGDEVEELYSLSGGVGELIRIARAISTYAEFQRTLEALRVSSRVATP
jgi:hypothetical protein